MSDSSHTITPTVRWKLIPRSRQTAALTIRQILEMLEPERVLYQRLLPRTKEIARPNTLSSRHGLEIFPAHTDFVTADVPPRYLVLTAARPRPAATLIFDTCKLVDEFGLEHLERSLFLLHGRTARYCRLLTLHEGKSLFRYNKALMLPQNREAHLVANYIENAMNAQCRVNWSQYRVAIVDNWNTFHGREACNMLDNVGLFRFAVWGKNELDR